MRTVKIERVVMNSAKTGAIEFSLFSVIAGVILIAVLDAAGGSVNTLFTVVVSALQSVASV